jgi:hypothetical protein
MSLGEPILSFLPEQQFGRADKAAHQKESIPMRERNAIEVFPFIEWMIATAQSSEGGPSDNGLVK